jgi:hypothetical protein
MTPREFLNLLWQYKPEEQYVLIWTAPNKQSHWFTDLETAGGFVANVTTLDVYVGLGLSHVDRGPARRVKSEEVSAICGIGTDLDLRSEAHGIKPLPGTLAEALSVLPKDVPPTIVLSTGNGAHAWWLFKEPIVFDSDEERAEVARVTARWHTMLRIQSAAKGWAYDRLSDLARILRIPGTQNLKDRAHPKPVAVYSRTDRFYNLSDLEEYLNDTETPDPEEEERAAREWKERFADKPLKIDLAATIPQEMLDAWMDPANSDVRFALRFRNTWERRRDNLKDPSQSGYDLALADFGIEAGLSEQQIVDLIIHHRRLHRLKPRNRLDYYQRTIARAEKRTGGRAAHNPTTGPAAPTGAQGAPEDRQATDDTTPPPPPTPEQEASRKAAICAGISLVLTVNVMRLVQITGKDSQYRMELAEGHKIEFPTVNKFLSMECVASAIADKVRKRIPRIKPKKWEEVQQMMLDALYVMEGTEEMQWEGAARMYLQHYLVETNPIPAIEGQRLQEQRKPMVIDGRISVCASSVLNYVNKTWFQNLSVKNIAGMMAAIGAESRRVRSSKHKDQTRWLLPLEEFNPADYPRGGGNGDGR